MIITKIEIQKNNPDRVNIFTDNKFFCGLDIEVLYSLNLKEGNELTDSLQSTLLESNSMSKCYRKAISLLNYRDRTSFELIKKLKEKLFDENEIIFTINKLKANGYINDDNFIETYINYNKDVISKQKILTKLWQFGIPIDLIKSKLNQLIKEGDEYNSCLKDLQNKIRFGNCEREKLVRHLLYKGYKYDIVTKVLKDHFPQ